MTTSYRKTTRKPATPEQQLARALELAHQKGLKVAGEGTLTDGTRFYLVPSDSEALKGLAHTVTRIGAHLFCTCLYAQNTGRVCAHRAATFEYLKSQTSQKQQEAPVAAPLPVGELARQAEQKPTPAPTADQLRRAAQRKAEYDAHFGPGLSKSVEEIAENIQEEDAHEQASRVPAVASQAERAVRRENALPYDDGEGFSIYKTTDSGRTLRDQAHEPAAYVPADYKSHEYR